MIVPAISVKNLTKSFSVRGSVTGFLAVNNISFEVGSGEIFAFLGPNGAGKSTTIKMLTTLLAPTSGTLNLNGINVLDNPHEARKSFGIVFQDPSLDDELTAFENMEFHAVLYGVKNSGLTSKIKELLEFVELYDRKDDLVKTFSGGMRRRLEIARGLLHHPKILFLDEPTLGLDPQTRNSMWKYVQNLNKKEGLTIFFTTHYMEEAEKNAMRIAIIDHGKIITSGSAESLKKETKTKSLEDAFLKLTGSNIRDEKFGSIDNMRQHRQMWARR